jgi:hypothetical protein
MRNPDDTERTKPHLEPYLIPDSPGGQPAKLPALVRALLVMSGSRSGTTTPKTPAVKNRLRRRKPDKYTIEQAFNFYFTARDDDVFYSQLNLERALRAVAFLLHWCSNTGNEPVEGNAANGLGYILEFTASQIRFCMQSKKEE